MNLYTNNATTALAAGLSNVATTLTVTTGGGSLFPVITSGNVFNVTLVNGGGGLEIVQVTARTGDVFTIVRAQGGTGAGTFVTGDKVELRITAANATGWETKVSGAAPPDIQAQTYVAFSTTGTSAAYALTPVPAITSYISKQRFQAAFHVSGDGSSTINVNGLGAINIKQYDSTGTKIAAVIVLSQLADIEYDGVDFVILNPLPIISGLTGFRNKIINGNFVVNQRAVSGTVTLGANSYGHDRFKSGAGGCAYTFSTSANGMILNITAGTLLQIIEGANLEGGSMKLSWFGTSTGRIDTGGYSASGVVGTAVAGTNQTVEFGPGTLARVQYELGTVVTTFEQRAIGLELVLCQRYFEFMPGPVYATYINIGSSTTRSTNISYQTVKRVAPTVGFIGTSEYIVNSGAGTDVTPSANVITTSGFSVWGGNFSIGVFDLCYSGTNKGIQISAEL